MVKDIFLQNGGKCNAYAYVSCSNRSRFKDPDPSYLVLNLVTIVPAIVPAGTEIWSKNVFLQGCDLERSRSSVKINNILHCNLHPTHKYICEVWFRSY